MWQILLWIVMIVAGIGAVGGLYTWLAFRPPSSLKGSASDFTLTDVTCVTPGLERREQYDLTIRNGVIQRMEATASSAKTGQEMSRYAGAYVLPGLIDMHTHLPPDSPLKLTGQFCFLYLAHGVTSVREAGDLDGTAVPAARQGMETHAFPGPRLYTCGPFIGGAPASWANTAMVQHPGDAAAAVARVKAAGHHAVKSYDNLSVEQIQELKAAAAQHDLPVLGHVSTELSYEEALIPDVQHLLGVPEPRSLQQATIINRLGDWQDVDEARLDHIVETTLAHDIINTPTMVVTQQLLRYANYQEMLTDSVACLTSTHGDQTKLAMQKGAELVSAWCQS